MNRSHPASGHIPEATHYSHAGVDVLFLTFSLFIAQCRRPCPIQQFQQTPFLICDDIYMPFAGLPGEITHCLERSRCALMFS